MTTINVRTKGGQYAEVNATISITRFMSGGRWSCCTADSVMFGPQRLCS
jgi:hypothetical protein